jgi:hypothetical protein
MPKSKNTKETAGTAGGAVVGTGVGLASSAAIVSASGAVAGLSGAGITSGLVAVGGTILGGAAILTCGTVVLAAAGAFAGYKLFSKK